MAGAASSGLGSGGSSSLSSGEARGVLDVAGRLADPALRPVERLAQPVVEALPVEDDCRLQFTVPKARTTMRRCFALLLRYVPCPLHGSPPPRASLN